MIPRNLSGSTGWHLPGAIVWVALAYAGAGSWMVRRLVAPLVATNARQQQVEPDLRYGLVQATTVRHCQTVTALMPSVAVAPVYYPADGYHAAPATSVSAGVAFDVGGACRRHGH